MHVNDWSIYLSFSIEKRDDYGLESGLIMRKGFLDHSHVPDGKFRISKIANFDKNVFVISCIIVLTLPRLFSILYLIIKVTF